MKISRVLRTLVLTVLAAFLGTAAEAVDMTGTWEGKERCGCFDEAGGKSTERYNNEVMEVTQDGTDLNIEAYGELFNGNVIDHPRSSSKGEAALIACNTDPTDNVSFGEIGRAKVWARDGGRGRMIVESLWNAGEDEICTCKGNFRRTATTDPEVDDCSGAAEAAAMDAWHLAMMDNLPADAGCFEADYPDGWFAVDCAEDSSKRSRSAGGGASRTPESERGNDWVVRVKGNPDKSKVMHKVTGSFPTVTNVTSINSSGRGDNTYSIQLNTQWYHLEKGASENDPHYDVCNETIQVKGYAPCTAWQQFLFNSDGTGANDAELDIQYWLGRTTHACPADWNWECHPNLAEGVPCPVGGSRSCYLDVAGEKSIPPLPVADLDKLQVTGIADDTHDNVIVRADGVAGYHTTLHAFRQIRTTDATASLARHWRQAEFNIFGFDSKYPNAVFNDPPSGERTELEVQIAVETVTAGANLECLNTGGGWTGEYNNLTLTDKCQPVRRGSHTFRFTQEKQ